MQIMKQLSIKGLFLPAIALCSLLLSGNAAHAALVTYSFQGAVSEVTGVLFPTLNTGQTMTGNRALLAAASRTVAMLAFVLFSRK